MAIDFKVKDVIHKITVKFVYAFLPEAKKAYNLKAVHQSELDIYEIASKADSTMWRFPRRFIAGCRDTQG